MTPLPQVKLGLTGILRRKENELAGSKERSIKPKSTIVQDKTWREATAKEFFKEYGPWWVFTGGPRGSWNKPSWMDQFNTEYNRKKKEALNGESENKTVRGKIN